MSSEIISVKKNELLWFKSRMFLRVPVWKAWSPGGRVEGTGPVKTSLWRIHLSLALTPFLSCCLLLGGQMSPPPRAALFCKGEHAWR